MIRRDRGRPTPRGLTLTEILISILIMGIGLLSLATLFPLGLLRLREANRASRSALLAASAGSDLTAAGILYKPFYQVLYGFDPFIADPPGLASLYGKGFPVCIDPLWWNEIESRGITDRPTALNDATVNQVTRFGTGINFVRNNGNGTPPSAFGLPRLSPYGVVGTADPVTAQRQAFALTQMFGSPDDLVYQNEGDSNRTVAPEVDWADGVGSTLVPQMIYNGAVPLAPLVDLSYTWVFTGRQTDVGNALTFDGDIVIMHNRPFAVDPVAPNRQRVANEVVVEAIWGYGPPVPFVNPRPTRGYAANDTSVLLRWPATDIDPEIRVGSWLADVSYQRESAIAYGPTGNEGDGLYDFWNSYPAQRCNWYRITNRTEPVLENGTGYKRVVVSVDRPLRAKTPVDVDAQGQPISVIVESALVSPNVVMVYPKVLVIK